MTPPDKPVAAKRRFAPRGPARLLSIAEACDRLGISRATIYRLVAAGELRSVSIGARRLIPEAEINAFVSAKLAEGQS